VSVQHRLEALVEVDVLVPDAQVELPLVDADPDTLALTLKPPSERGLARPRRATEQRDDRRARIEAVELGSHDRILPTKRTGELGQLSALQT
jgi:hypothetical protein